MRVQHRNGTGLTLKLRIVSREGIEGFPSATNQQVINDALLLPGQRAQLPRQCKGEHKVLGRHLFLPLTIQPLLAFMALTVWAVAMPAGMRDKDLLVTAVALRHHHGLCVVRHCFSADRALSWLGSTVLYVARNSASKVWMIDDSNHLTPRQSTAKPSISALINASA